MKTLLVRADDIGYTEGVTMGILSAHKNGIVTCTGFMVNTGFATQTAVLLKDYPDLCVGLHVNVVIGSPCADPQLIPHLLREDGSFVPSAQRRKEMAKGEDLISYDEALIEIDAQMQRYLSLMGKKPEYIDVHAILNPNLIKAIVTIGKRYDIKDCPFYEDAAVVAQLEDSPQYPYFKSGKPLEAFWKEYTIKEDIPQILMVHPAFIDYELFTSSSLINDRLYDYALCTKEESLRQVQLLDIKIASYRDL